MAIIVFLVLIFFDINDASTTLILPWFWPGLLLWMLIYYGYNIRYGLILYDTIEWISKKFTKN